MTQQTSITLNTIDEAIAALKANEIYAFIDDVNIINYNVSLQKQGIKYGGTLQFIDLQYQIALNNTSVLKNYNSNYNSKKN